MKKVEHDVLLWMYIYSFVTFGFVLNQSMHPEMIDPIKPTSANPAINK